MPRPKSLGRIPQGFVVIAQRRLVCTHGSHHKEYTGLIMSSTDGSNEFIGACEWGRIGGSSSQNAVYYRGISEQQARAVISDRLDEKRRGRGGSRYSDAPGTNPAAGDFDQLAIAAGSCDAAPVASAPDAPRTPSAGTERAPMTTPPAPERPRGIRAALARR